MSFVYVYPTSELLLDGVHWTDVSADLFGENGVSIKYGMADGKPTTCVAQTGECHFWLNNSEHNSASKRGYYSPDNAANVRSGFQRNVRARMSFTFSGTTYYKFVGRVKEIVPAPGIYGIRTSACVAVDYMDDLARANLKGIPAATNQRGDQVLTTFLAAMPTQPAATSFDTGIGIWPYVLIRGSDGVLNGLSECQRVAMSEGTGYVYVKGDTTTGGVFRFDNRHRRPANNTNASTLDASWFLPETGVEAPASIDDLINNVQVTTHSRTVDVSNVVLYIYAPPTVATAIGPGQSITIISPYRDPNQQASQVAAASIVTPLVATTDYTMNAASDGSSTDLTGSFTVAASSGGTAVFLTITNGSAVPGYITRLQVRGKGIYDYNPIVSVSEDSSSETTYGANVLPIDLPYESDPVIGQGVADVIRRSWANPFGVARSVSFLANRSSTTMTAALAREPGDRVSISETVSGISAGFWIQGVELTAKRGGILLCKWILAPADPLSYWVLGQVGRSELGTTTRLWPI